MKKITQTEFKKNIDQYLDEAQDGPIEITLRGKASVVLVSIAEWERLTQKINNVKPAEKRD